MFGGKREKALLEEELEAVKKENERLEKLLASVTEQKDSVLEQFARMTASRAQMQKDTAQIKENMEHIYGLAENCEKVAGDIHSTMVATYNGLNSFDANHSFFIEQVKKQDAKIMEIVESNKHFTTPMKHITEAQTTLKEEREALRERAERMHELGKRMALLALDAAIKAGRMGDVSNDFVAAAEEIRIFCENYDSEATALEEQVAQSEARAAELEEQIRHLNELLKENNISMGKLYKDSAQSMLAYDAQQIDIRNLIPEDLIGRADALKQSEQECTKTKEELLRRVGTIWDEIHEHKSSADELEAIWKKIYRAMK